jgi:hypothetical protein
VLQVCVIVALQGCVIVALQGCVIVPLHARLREELLTKQKPTRVINDSNLKMLTITKRYKAFLVFNKLAIAIQKVFWAKFIWILPESGIFMASRQVGNHTGPLCRNCGLIQ